MMNRPLKILVLLLMVSCSERQDEGKLLNNYENNQKTEFEKYVETLEKINFPLSHNPMIDFPILSKNFNKQGFEKYKHTWTSKPAGVFYNDGKIIGIIDCSVGDFGLAPFLTTYDFNGNKIDSTNFYKKTGVDIGYNAIEYIFSPNQDKIIVVDTVRRWEIDETNFEVIEESLNTSTGVTEYTVMKSGKIQIKTTF